MEIHKERKFSSTVRRKIVNKLSKIKNKTDFINIFNLIESELGKDISIGDLICVFDF